MSIIKLKLTIDTGMTEPEREKKLFLWAKALVNGGEVKELDRQELKDSNGKINRIDVTLENTYKPTSSGLCVDDNYEK